MFSKKRLLRPSFMGATLLEVHHTFIQSYLRLLLAMVEGIFCGIIERGSDPRNVPPWYLRAR
jgi:hypothetical protein